jgi:hypothetical protein
VDSDNTKITCIVTIHGIGFQQPPSEGKPGYADDLHAHLCRELNQNGNVLLSDDPDRRSYQQRESVPIYVQSVWPSHSGSFSREEGLMRLGSWVGHHRTAVNHDRTHDPNQALVKDKERIAHVALVYSELEGEGSEREATLEVAAMVLLYRKRYTHFRGLVDTVFEDTQPFLQSLWTKPINLLKRTPDPAPRASISVRQDEGYPNQNVATQQLGGLHAILSQLKNDVAAYVCHNGARQRIRNFVRDALLRIAFRDDVSGIVLNTHSNGTVIGIDALQELPPSVADKILAIITAGSPIRKYVDLFSWGKHLAVMPKIDQWIGQWWNFYDKRDIVADRLLPCAAWDREKEPTEEQLTGIYQAFDLSTGDITPILINDKLVHNIPNSPVGGMQAHNYWDNTVEFIPEVAKILRNVL